MYREQILRQTIIARCPAKATKVASGSNSNSNCSSVTLKSWQEQSGKMKFIGGKESRQESRKQGFKSNKVDGAASRRQQIEANASSRKDKRDSAILAKRVRTDSVFDDGDPGPSICLEESIAKIKVCLSTTKHLLQYHISHFLTQNTVQQLNHRTRGIKGDKEVIMFKRSPYPGSD